MCVKTVFGYLAVALVLATSVPDQPSAAEPFSVVALGDSLTAGYGLQPGQSFPEQLQARLLADGYNVEVTNAGVSGDTSSGGLARLDWSVPADADGVIVALGANDALRGIDPAITRKSLTEIVERLTERGQAVLLAGMLAPRNLGAEYAEKFDAIYRDLGKRREVLLLPFFLEDVAGVPALNQADGIHPTSEGVARIVENILPRVQIMVSRVDRFRQN